MMGGLPPTNELVQPWSTAGLGRPTMDQWHNGGPVVQVHSPLLGEWTDGPLDQPGGTGTQGRSWIAP